MQSTADPWIEALLCVREAALNGALDPLRQPPPTSRHQRSGESNLSLCAFKLVRYDLAGRQRQPHIACAFDAAGRQCMLVDTRRWRRLGLSRAVRGVQANCRLPAPSVSHLDRLQHAWMNLCTH